MKPRVLGTQSSESIGGVQDASLRASPRPRPTMQDVAAPASGGPNKRGARVAQGNVADAEDDAVIDSTAGEAAGETPSGESLEGMTRALVDSSKDYARREDLVKMHKSLLASLRALGEGLEGRIEAKAAADRAELSGRLDEVEAAVNGMEAVLRIQLLPEIRSAVEEALDKRAPKAGRRFPAIFLWILSVVLVGAAGVFFADHLAPLAIEIKSFIGGFFRP